MAAANNGTMTVRISAVDDATKTLAKINKQMAAFGLPLKNLQKQMTQFGKLSGLSAAASGFQSLGRRATEAASSIARVVTPLAAITGLGSIAGLYKIIDGWGIWGNQISINSRLLGVTTDELNNMNNASKIAGAGSDALADSFKNMQDNLRGVKLGTNIEAMRLFAAAGIDAADSTEKATRKAFEFLKNAHYTPAQLRTAMGIFGISQSLVNVVAEGAAGYDKLIEEAKKYGFVSQENIENAKQFATASNHLSVAIDALTKRIAGALGPALGSLLDDFALWIATSPDVEYGLKKLSEGARDFSAWLRTIEFKKIYEDIKALLIRINDIVQAFGGWKIAIEAIIALKIGGFVIGLLSPFAQLALGVGRVTAAMIAMRTASTAAAAAAAAAAGTGAATTGAGLGLGARLLGLGSRIFRGAAMEGFLLPQMWQAGRDHMDNDPRWRRALHKPDTTSSPPPPSGSSSSDYFGQRYGANSGAATPPGTSTSTASRSHADFYNKWGPAAALAGAQLGVDPNIILGHWAQETVYGRNLHDNNPGNMQASASFTGRTVVRGDTHADGSAYRTRFRVFDTPEEFAAAYVGNIRRMDPNAVGAGSNALRYGQGLAAGHYFENPNGARDIAATAARVAAERGATANQLQEVLDANARARERASNDKTSQAAPNTLDVTINHSGVPQGVMLSARASGPMLRQAPRVQSAMAGVTV